MPNRSPEGSSCKSLMLNYVPCRNRTFNPVIKSHCLWGKLLNDFIIQAGILCHDSTCRLTNRKRNWIRGMVSNTRSPAMSGKNEGSLQTRYLPFLDSHLLLPDRQPVFPSLPVRTR